MNLVEAMAKAIYAKWDKLPGWVPWVDGGNSNMQDLARDCARAALNALADNVSDEHLTPLIDSDMCCATLLNFAAAIRAAGEG